VADGVVGMTKQLKISTPLTLEIPRKTKPPKIFRINLNYTRNAHFQEMNKAKIMFKDLVEQLLVDTGQRDIVFDKPVNVTAKLYKQSNRRSDKHNFIAANTKFLYDALTELGIIVDDNDEYIKIETMYETEVDKNNPRVEYVFTEVE